MAVAVPFFYRTKSKRQHFLYDVNSRKTFASRLFTFLCFRKSAWRKEERRCTLPQKKSALRRSPRTYTLILRHHILSRNARKGHFATNIQLSQSDKKAKGEMGTTL